MVTALAFVAANWLTILKLILLVGTGAAVGYTIYKYISAVEQPAVTQTFAVVAQLAPLMVTMMVFNLMTDIMGTMRDLLAQVPRSVAK